MLKKPGAHKEPLFELELLPGAPYMTIESGGSSGFAYALLVLVEKIPGFGGR